MIKDNIEYVQSEMKKACEKSNRDINDVKLICVSKTKPVSDIQEAYDAGARDFGENKVQELMDKIDKLPDDIRWHLIGHLQTNKVKYVVGKVFMIHSVDSLKLAAAIDKESEKKNVITDILLEVNISGEESKFGLKPEKLSEVVSEIEKLEHVNLKGFMTVPPIINDSSDNSVYFKRLKDLSVDIMGKKTDNNCGIELSMGMSDDYRTAIECGATYVRVGSFIFGARDYSKL
ncbi:MAG: YggS family pyridoxal phosphate-dependent enzyme [Lachnospiraceae bacterium]|nr:YggS family pyridoxal phosphate-dependent enzyme [Lachnospiraceae bacterium]